MSKSFRDLYDTECQQIMIAFLQFIKMPEQDIDKLLGAPLGVGFLRHHESPKILDYQYLCYDLNNMYNWSDIEQNYNINLANYHNYAWRTPGPHHENPNILDGAYNISLFKAVAQEDLF